MKPAWDSLMREYEGHPSVLIGDVDCTQHQDLCSDMGVGGYPTIKYWTDVHVDPTVMRGRIGELFGL